MGTAHVICSRCQNRIEISDLLNADLRLLCDKIEADLAAAEAERDALKLRLASVTVPVPSGADYVAMKEESEQLRSALRMACTPPYGPGGVSGRVDECLVRFYMRAAQQDRTP